MSKLFDNLKEPKRKTEAKDARVEIAQDFERLKSESIAYFAMMKALERMKDEAQLQIHMTCGESTGMAKYWKGRMSAIDEIQGLPDVYERKAIAAGEERKQTSIV